MWGDYVMVEYYESNVVQVVEVEIYLNSNNDFMSAKENQEILAIQLEDGLNHILSDASILEVKSSNIQYDNDVINFHIEYLIRGNVEADYIPEIHTYSNGDPGEPEDFDIINVTGLISSVDKRRLLSVLKNSIIGQYMVNIEDIDVYIIPDIEDSILDIIDR